MTHAKKTARRPLRTNGPAPPQDLLRFLVNNFTDLQVAYASLRRASLASWPAVPLPRRPRWWLTRRCEITEENGELKCFFPLPRNYQHALRLLRRLQAWKAWCAEQEQRVHERRAEFLNGYEQLSAREALRQEEESRLAILDLQSNVVK